MPSSHQRSEPTVSLAALLDGESDAEFRELIALLYATSGRLQAMRRDLAKALEALDTDKSGEVDEEEWDEAIHRGLAARLEQLREERERGRRHGFGGVEDCANRHIDVFVHN